MPVESRPPVLSDRNGTTTYPHIHPKLTLLVFLVITLPRPTEQREELPSFYTIIRWSF
jgi:hypothetical protein